MPLVPEGPHGDAVLPHQAPHGAATTLHTWLGVWGGEGPGAHSHCPPNLVFSQPEAGWKESPTSWREEEGKDPKARGEGEALLPACSS